MFAESVADIFSANGIKVYLFESLRPTPEISYAIRHLGCQAGVNVTASHNPREYNGYKAYWDDGAQVLAPHDVGIIAEVEKVKISDVKFEGNKELIIPIGGEMDWDYIQAVKEAMVDQDVILRQKDLNIVYSPMHGTGRVIIPRPCVHGASRTSTSCPSRWLSMVTSPQSFLLTPRMPRL